jgi:hypothetical protein
MKGDTQLGITFEIAVAVADAWSVQLPRQVLMTVL